MRPTGPVGGAPAAWRLPAAEVAPAKVNLALHVTGRRADGYHRLDSLVCFTEDGDLLEVAAAEDDGLSVAGRFAGGVPEGGGNIVLAALSLARSHLTAAGRDVPPLAIRLDKRLPVAAGIGGGSADAACLLRLVADAAPALRAEIGRASLAVGADVPMCFEGRPCRVGGIGDLVEPLGPFPALSLVLVNPGTPLATPDVFRALARSDNPGLPDLPAGGFADTAGLVVYLAGTRNDLEAAATALAPGIAVAAAALRASGALLARMSGSGATVFGIFPDAGRAEAAAGAIARRHRDWWVLATQGRPA